MICAVTLSAVLIGAVFTPTALAAAGAANPVAQGAGAVAQSSNGKDLNCPEYEGVVCQGLITDVDGLLRDREALEARAVRMYDKYGHQTVVVIAQNFNQDIAQFAPGVAETWVVTDSVGKGGVVVAIEIGARKTWVVAGQNLQKVIPDADLMVNSSGPSFASGDYDGGINVILGMIEASYANPPASAGTPQPAQAGDAAPSFGTPNSQFDGETALGVAVIAMLVAGSAVVSFAGNGQSRAQRRRAKENQQRQARTQSVDDQLDRLEITGTDLVDLRQYELSKPPVKYDLVMDDTARHLSGMKKDHSPDAETTRVLWSHDLLDVIDGNRLAKDCEIPLDMRASDDDELLDDAIQDSAREALDVPLKDEPLFRVKLKELTSLIESSRPFRVAQANKRFADRINDHLVQTPLGSATLSDLGERLLQAAPVLQAERTSDAIEELEEAYSLANTKVERLDSIYRQLPDSAARPAVAAALADLDADADNSAERYEQLRQQLEEKGQQLKRDQLDVEAIAALLLMNNDEKAVSEFVELYTHHRRSAMAPSLAVEYSLAGLRTKAEIERVKRYVSSEGIPVAIVSALLANRRDGIAVYKQIEAELIDHKVKGDTRRTIAGVLATSLEPAAAVRRWVQARQALAKLGLVGSYADIAAAFGASDSRGPQAFALAYAAQRQALRRSDIDDADRFAPELAHSGTSGQNDTWTGEPIPPTLGSFDPFTMFYMHWIISGGTDQNIGWEPVYNDASWSRDTDSWFGGSFAGGSSGGFFGGGGSWGSGSSSGGFGGFGGGFSGGSGGFSGGGGSW